jgi:hypothetical protein
MIDTGNHEVQGPIEYWPFKAPMLGMTRLDAAKLDFLVPHSACISDMIETPKSRYFASKNKYLLAF